ncbi:N-ethylmaleimide-sensitive fusion protein [Tieghemostelium lacteum]|uniref:Vesicle-fusing ATPase n=1 Tax=Tieghemostelium lacteum TaxID=361077 RepID=A0A151ZB78_TIELA|nr:N-ethylmaleimide-sensitive fusion protein [Tieghemostelium lacteum]|eukprot:KYQ91185.1 N-ethylmaleimide-sensitive fusion protein [Tieghemostelium lacteum]
MSYSNIRGGGMAGAEVNDTVFIPQGMTNEEQSYTNRCFISEQKFKEMFPNGSQRRINTNYVIVNNKFILSAAPTGNVPVRNIMLSRVQRDWMQVGTVNATCNVEIYEPELLMLTSITLVVDCFKAGSDGKADAQSVIGQFLSDYDNQILTPGQVIAMVAFGNQPLRLKVEKIQLSPDSSNPKGTFGMLSGITQILLVKAEGSRLDIETNGDLSLKSNMFKIDWDFENMGIGGLDAEFRDIFRRAFASRLFPPSLITKLGVNHVRGMLLYGPPGTGKTLIARQIGKMLNGREPKLVSGPSILDKYVGGSENNVRMLFREAEIEQKQKGENSGLHIIILDELDAICKTRGTRQGDSGVGDSVVNQLLAMIDGVESLNNILVIGMTNRKEMIDDALLRPGRLEVHVEISLPNEEGREQIFTIHTAKMKKNNALDSSVNLAAYAKETKNYSGAEIEGVVKAAASYTFSRQIDTKNLTNMEIKPDDIKVTDQDFRRAISEVKPGFGAVEDQYENYAHNGIVNYGSEFEKVANSGKLFIEQVKTSLRTPLVSVLLTGEPGSGKSSLATYFAKQSEFPFVRIISPQDMLGMTETAKAQRITKAFEDSYKTPLSCIIIDDIERLIEYVPIGPRFSNLILQTLHVLYKKTPPKKGRLLILSTTSNPSVLRDMDLMDCFPIQVETPSITKKSEFKAILQELGAFSSKEAELASQYFNDRVTIKQLIMIIEMARQEKGDPVENLKYMLTEFQLKHI